MRRPSRPRPQTWGGLVLALVAGAAAGLAHPPFGLLPGLLGYALLLFSLDRAAPARPLRSAFARGWAAGFGYFLAATWWVGEAFMVDAAAHAWQAPFAVTLLPAGLALFWGAAGALYRKLAPPGLRRVLVFAALFALAEWLRGHVLTGFPWDLPGETWRAGGGPSQVAALVGVYGLSFLTLAVAAAPAQLADPVSRRRRAIAVGAAVAALACGWGWGAWRLAHATEGDTALRLRIVQPDIPQAVKWTPEAFYAIVDRYMAMTAAPSEGPPPDVVIWPESAIPAPADALLSEGTWVRADLMAALRPGQTLLTGLYREEGERPDYFNSLYAIARTDAGIEVRGRYDKHRLVPFGEYLPLQSLLEKVGLDKLAAGEPFSPGPFPAPITPEGLPPLQPLICYESLFPGFTHGGEGRPAWIVNVSNDAWFGRTSGPWQHLNLASYRAIEEGLPLVRATPTGVSAVVDPYGRTLSRLALGERGVIDAVLPAAAAPPPYTDWREGPFWVMCLAGLACAFRRKRG